MVLMCGHALCIQRRENVQASIHLKVQVLCTLALGCFVFQFRPILCGKYRIKIKVNPSTGKRIFYKSPVLALPVTVSTTTNYETCLKCSCSSSSSSSSCCCCCAYTQRTAGLIKDCGTHQKTEAFYEFSASSFSFATLLFAAVYETLSAGQGLHCT